MAGTNILGEGPVWDHDEHVLWWVDIADRSLHRYSPVDENVMSWDLPESPGSLALTGTDRLLLAVQSGIAVFDPSSGEYEMVANPEPDLPNNRFNDGKCDRQGRFWVGSMHENDQDRTGSLHRIDADFSHHRITDGIGIPNSLAWSPDSKTMYFAETLDRTIYAYDYDADSGLPSNRRVFAVTPAPGFPDGSTVDAAGFLWNAEFNGWRLVRYAPDGSVDRAVKMPVQSPTCCTFGGPDLDVLFVTSASRDVPRGRLWQQPNAGSLFAVSVGVAGIPETRFAGRFSETGSTGREV